MADVISRKREDVIKVLQSIRGIFDMEMRLAGVLDTERSGVYYIAGPINGNPYAQIDISLKAKLRGKPDQGKPYDLAKGIEDLDSLLVDLGYDSTPSSPPFKQDSRILISSQADKRDLKATVLFSKEINNNSSDAPLRRDNFDEPFQITSKLPAVSDLRTGASDSKAGGNINFLRNGDAFANRPVPIDDKERFANQVRSVIEDDISAHQEVTVLSTAPLRGREGSLFADDVFDSEVKASSPTINDLLFDVSKSSASKGASKKNMSLTRYDNVSYYDGETESRSNDSFGRQDSTDGMEIQPGTVASHVKSLNRLLFGDDMRDRESQYKKKYGVPLAGLNAPEEVEKGVTQFNLRSCVPGQLAPQTTHIYTRGAFREVDYQHREERRSGEPEPVHHIVAKGNVLTSKQDDTEADTPMKTRQSSVAHQKVHIQAPALLHLVDGRVETKPAVVREENLPKIDTRHEVDSAYGDSRRNSPSFSSAVTTPNTTPSSTRLPKPDLTGSRKLGGSTASDLGVSSSSSWSSIDDEGAGYARIEDLRLMCSTTERGCTDQQSSQSAGAAGATSARQPTSALKIVEEDLQAEVIQKPVEFLRDDVFVYLDECDIKTEAIPKPTEMSPVSPTSETPTLRFGEPNVTEIYSHPGFAYKDFNYSTPSSAAWEKFGSPLVLDSSSSDLSTGTGLRWTGPPPRTSSNSGETSTGSISDGSSSPKSPSTVARTRRRMRGCLSNSSVSAELFHEVERHPQIKFDKETMHYWYKPNFSREQATALLKDRDCGTFVVRDSQSYEGAFGLAVKVETPPLGVLQQAGGDLTKIDLDNELVRHFLIEPCKKGVRLKGSNNEPPFPSLVALVYQHTLTKMALPVALVIPEEDLEESQCGLKSTLSESQLLQKGAACNLLYLGGVDVESLTGDGAVQYAMNKLLSGNDLPKWTLASIKVNQEGITLTDNQRRLFFRRHYPMKLVLHCGVDPNGRTFNLKVALEGSDREASCFGIVVAKDALSLDNECHLFAESEADQPSSAVINFIHKAMRYAKV